MVNVAEVFEMNDTSKQARVSIENDHSGSIKEVAASSATGYGRDIENQAKIRRLFGFAQIFAFSLTFMFSWEGMCTNMWFALYNGGPQTFAWSILMVYCGALAQSASIAEMASIQPIAGAQYHWTHHLAPPRWKRLITWMQGWTTWFGWVSLLAGSANATALFLQSLVSLNHPNYVSERWHVTLIVVAELVVAGLMNMYTFWMIPWIELVAGIGHVCFFVVYIAVLLTMGPRHSGRYIFFETSIASGWKDKFISFNVGMLGMAWSFTGFDGVVHMSEEVRKAKQAVPRALFWTIALGGVLAYVMVIVLLTTMGSMEDALQSVFPIITIVHQVTGSLSVTTAMIVAIFIIAYAGAIASVSSTSRLTWAWARDGGLPAWFSYVSPKHHVPERAVCFVCVLVGLLCILNVGSTAAFGAIIALSSLYLYISYIIAISCMLYARFQKDPVKLGGWNLGRYGAAINIFALLYTGWVVVFLPFPTTLPVTSLNMNYAGPILLAVFLFATGLWIFWARKHWAGPNVNIIRFVVAQD